MVRSRTERLYRSESVIEQSETAPQEYLVTITGGDCNYVSVSDGVGGFTWQADGNTCLAGCGTCPIVDADFLEENGTPTSAGETLTVSCADCEGPRWNGKVEVPDGDSLRRSATRIIRNIQRGAATAPSLGDQVWVRQYFGQWLIVASAEVDSGGDGSSGSSCACDCDCLNCVVPCRGEWAFISADNGSGGFTWVPDSENDTIKGTCADRPEVDAGFLEDHGEPTGLGETLMISGKNSVPIVTDCADCPKGALWQYFVDVGDWTAWPELGGRLLLTQDAGECFWNSRVIVVRDPVSGCKGAYQYRLTQAGIDSSLRLFHVTGEDPLGLIIPSLPDLPVYVVEWVAVGAWSCLCQVKMQAKNGDQFPDPDGLRCQICIEPGNEDEVDLARCNGIAFAMSVSGVSSAAGDDFNGDFVLVSNQTAPITSLVGCQWNAGNGVYNWQYAYGPLYAIHVGPGTVARYLFSDGDPATDEIIEVVFDPTFVVGGLSPVDPDDWPDKITLFRIPGELADDDTTPDDCCDGDCSYTSISNGSGGFTWQLSSDTCTGGCAACATVDSAFLTEHGAPTGLGQTLTVACAA
jgi:hypothetical protein